MEKVKSAIITMMGSNITQEQGRISGIMYEHKSYPRTPNQEP